MGLFDDRDRQAKPALMGSAGFQPAVFGETRPAGWKLALWGCLMIGIGRLEACATRRGDDERNRQAGSLRYGGRVFEEGCSVCCGAVFLGLFLFLFYTWAMPLIDPDEPRYASTAREMALNGDWIVPHFNGEPRINKPPIVYWAIALCYKLLGFMNWARVCPPPLRLSGRL